MFFRDLDFRNCPFLEEHFLALPDLTHHGCSSSGQALTCLPVSLGTEEDDVSLVPELTRLFRFVGGILQQEKN